MENLLSLGVYRDWFEKAKEKKKDIKTKIESEAKEFALFVNNQEDAEQRLQLTMEKDAKWLEQKNKEKKELKSRLEDAQKRLRGASDVGEALLIYQEAQDRIQKINEEIPKIESQKKDLQEKLTLVHGKESEQKEYAQEFLEKFNELSREVKNRIEEKKKLSQEVEAIKKEEPGTKCVKCKGVISSKNIEEYVSGLSESIESVDLLAKSKLPKLKEMEEGLAELKSKQEKLKGMKSQIEEKIALLEVEAEKLRKEFLIKSKVKEPRASENELLLKQKIDEILEQIKKIELENESPFKDILINDEDQLNKIKSVLKEKKENIKSLEDKVPYYDYWISGFGEQGIRKWVIEGIIPDLNNRINYWLQFLMDNAITLSFDNELQEKIQRNPPDGDPYIYYAMSTGQRRRLNLAVGHSFAYITELSSDSVPSLIFLDEVTTNVDPSGVIGIYKMIKELSENKQVFVTTHDQDLIRMIESESKLQLVHENGFTKKL